MGVAAEADLTLLVSLIFFVSVGAAGLFFFVYWLRRRYQLLYSLNSVTLMVTIQKEFKEKSDEPKKEEKEIISIAEQMFVNLNALAHSNRGFKAFFVGRSHISFEIAALENEIRFYVTVPRKYQNFVEKQIHSQYPKSQVEEAGDFNIFRPGYIVTGTCLKLAKKRFLPIKTYKTLETDPLNSIANALSKLEKGEGAAVQILIRPAKTKWRHKGMKLAKKMQYGKGFEKAESVDMLSEAAHSLRNTIQDEQKRLSQKQGGAPYVMLTPMEQEIIKGIQEKANRIVFECVIRLIASAQTQERAHVLLSSIAGSFNQFSTTYLNKFFEQGELRRHLVRNFIFRYFNYWKRCFLSTEELASIFHFPTKFTETPNIKWLRAKTAPPPLNVPKEGALLGYNVYRGVRTPIRLTTEDRMRHMYLIGRTGTGKSTLLENMATQDIREGKGICVVDPHGDLVEAILANVPKERADDVIYFNPSDLERPMGLNMLEFERPEQKDFAVQEMIAIFYKLFPPEMIGPMFEHNMRNVMLTLMADREHPGTIAEIPRMFTDKEFQNHKVAKVSDPVVRGFWEKEMAQTSDFHKSEMLGYLISKVGRFVENEMMRHIIGQSHSGFNVRKIMNEGKILLVNLSKGKTGEVNSDLLGLIIVSMVQMAAMSRADMPQRDRKDFFLYIDEFQNYTTDSIATILSEARKYRLSLTMAHQYVGQLVKNNDTKIRDAVFGNVGSMLCYRIGVEDAEIFAKEFAPVFDENDVVNIEKYNLYAKIMMNGTAQKPCNLEVPPPYSLAHGNLELAAAIRDLSRLKYGRDRRIVEREILERSQLGASSVSGQSMIPGERNM